MKEVIANTFAVFDEVIDSIEPSTLCRGVSDSSYRLIPSLFRHPDIADIAQREEHLIPQGQSKNSRYEVM